MLFLSVKTYTDLWFCTGVFDSIVCTGQFKDAAKSEGATHEVVTKLSKAQVCADLGAILLIDDSAENALQVCTADEPTPVLLFGNYEWNKRICSAKDASDGISFDIRLAACGGKEFWKEVGLSDIVNNPNTYMNLDFVGNR